MTAGYLYAVEAAAAGAVALFVFGLATRALTLPVLALVLRNTMAVTGALFALFVAATTFTLVFRAFDSDRLLAALVAAIPGGGSGAVAAVLLVLGLCAFVLDAFEIILGGHSAAHAGAADARARRGLGVGADLAGAASELPDSAFRLRRDDGAQCDG